MQYYVCVPVSIYDSGMDAQAGEWPNKAGEYKVTLCYFAPTTISPEAYTKESIMSCFSETSHYFSESKETGIVVQCGVPNLSSTFPDENKKRFLLIDISSAGGTLKNIECIFDKRTSMFKVTGWINPTNYLKSLLVLKALEERNKSFCFVLRALYNKRTKDDIEFKELNKIIAFDFVHRILYIPTCELEVNED